MSIQAFAQIHRQFSITITGRTNEIWGLDMATWQDELIRLTELHRHEVERWLEGTGNANLVIDAGEAEKAFLLRWMSAGEPGRNEQMLD